MTKKTVTKKPPQNDYPGITCKSQKEWHNWLDKNHSRLNGVWLRFFKKASAIKTVNNKEALDEALCYGWIDGQANSFDENSWIQKYTPRRAKSIWSKRNIENISRLEKEGRMKPAGFKAVEGAKKDGRWEKAYDSPVNMKIPEDFLKAVSKNRKTLAFFNALNKSNIYAITWRLQTAKKPETREKRMKTILGMLKNGEKFH
ncbi:MAG: YdeI/OmpD-associated family protein [Bacteroidota bacterium]